MGKIVRNNFDISPLNVVQIDGEGNYNIEQVNNADGTCTLNISDAKQKEDWKEYYTHMIQRDTDTIVIPDGVEEIGSNAFYNWSNLNSVTFPNSLTIINTSAFYNCSSLDFQQLSLSLREIKGFAFRSCGALTLSQLPKNLLTIGQQAFDSCRQLNIKSLPIGIVKLESYTFEYCTTLTEITFEGNIQSFSSGVFQGCTNLTKFSFPNNTAVPTLANVNAIPKGANFTGQIAIPNTLYNSWTTASNWSSLTQAQWVRLIDSWDEPITVEGDYALFNDTSLPDVRHLVPTAQTYNVTLHNYVTGAEENMLILNGNPTVEQNSEYVVTIEKTDHLEAPSNPSTFTPYITINGIELSNANYSTTTTTYRNNTYPTTITIKPNVINGDIDVSLIYSEQPGTDLPFEEW